MEWKKQKSKEGLNYALLSAAGIITLLAVWQLVVSLGLVNERMLPAPTQIFETLMYKFANKAPDGNVLWVNILASLQVARSLIMESTDMNLQERKKRQRRSRKPLK